MNLGTTRLQIGRPPFVIAEMSGNHNGSLERALKLVDAAAAAGAQALKIQTYTADTMTLNLDRGDFLISDRNSPWHGKTLYQLYGEAHTPWSWHEAIFDRCKQRGILGFSTPFDASAVDFLERLNVPCYKIASFESIDLPLIRKVAATGKPLIISTGLASLAEIAEAVSTARAAGCQQVALLKCTSAYPAEPSGANLRTIGNMRDAFACDVGLSDHTLGIGVSVAAVAMGATILEKHLTLARSDGGVDAAFSLEPNEFSQLVSESSAAAVALGSVSYGPTAEERPSLQFRRSLYVASDIAKGELFTADSLRAVRPGFGLPPKYLEVFLGRRAARDLAAGTPASWDIVAD